MCWLLRIQTTKQQSKQPNKQSNQQTIKQWNKISKKKHHTNTNNNHSILLNPRTRVFVGFKHGIPVDSPLNPRPEKVTFSMSDVVAPPEAGFHPKIGVSWSNSTVRIFFKWGWNHQLGVEIGNALGISVTISRIHLRLFFFWAFVYSFSHNHGSVETGHDLKGNFKIGRDLFFTEPCLWEEG